MIFQHFNLLHNQTVADNVALPMRIAGESPAHPRAGEGVPGFRGSGREGRRLSRARRLSGGQKQRVAICPRPGARTHVLLADEPTSALDPRTTLDLLGVLADANRKFGVSILLVSHEMEVIRRPCHRVSVMEARRIVEQLNIADGRIPEGFRPGQLAQRDWCRPGGQPVTFRPARRHHWPPLCLEAAHA